MAVEKDFELLAGQTFVHPAQSLDAVTLVPLSYTGRKVRLAVYRSQVDRSVLMLASSDGATGTTANTSVTVTAATGSFTVRAEVAALTTCFPTPSARPQGYYQLYRVEPDDVTVVVLRHGKFYVR
jgi:hypothetical protein